MNLAGARASRRSAQRGVALITDVLMVALATILAVNVVYRGMLDQRRAGTLFALDQAFEIALGAEAWAADVLQRDQQQSQGDNYSETWAKPLPPLPLEGGSVAGRLDDLQGRFNLNNLVFADGTTNAAGVEQLARILVSLDLEPGWATTMADWIDEDTQPGFPDRAEDSVYTGQAPPYLAANMPVTRASELMSLPGFGPERYAAPRRSAAARCSTSSRRRCGSSRPRRCATSRTSSAQATSRSSAPSSKTPKRRRTTASSRSRC